MNSDDPIRNRLNKELWDCRGEDYCRRLARKIWADLRVWKATKAQELQALETK